MSSNTQETIQQLLDEAWQAGFTPEAMAKSEEAIRLADENDDWKLGYQARNAQMNIAVFSGYPEKLIAAFSWCLSQADQYPENISLWELLWKYKWVIDNLTQFPRISRSQILASLDDFHSRCLKAGCNERAFLYLRWCMEMQTGNLNAANEWYEKWKCTKRDVLSDCEACERNNEVRLFVAMGKHPLAIKKASPILNGKMRCGEIPHLTYAALLKSFWLTGQKEEADACHRKGYRLVRSNRNFIREQSWHVMHLLRNGQIDGAAVLVRKHLPWALESNSLDNRFHFLAATRAFLQQTAKSNLSTLRLRLPNDLCPVAGKTTVKIPALMAWMDGQIADLAAQFDARNGNQWSSQMAQSCILEE